MRASRTDRTTHPGAVFLAVCASACLMHSAGIAQAPGGAKSPAPKAAPAGKAPTSTRPAPTDAALALAGMRDALRAFPACSFHCSASCVYAGTVQFASETRQILRHDATDQLTGARLTGGSVPEGAVFAAGLVGGEFITVVDVAANVWEDMPWGSIARTQAPTTPEHDRDIQLVVGSIPVALWSPWMTAPTGTSVARLAGTQILDGVVCDVVEVRRWVDPPERFAGKGSPVDHQIRHLAEFVVGRDDHLPRRMTERTPGLSDKGEVFESGLVTTTYILTAWKLNPAATDDVFFVTKAGCRPGEVTTFPRAATSRTQAVPVRSTAPKRIKVGDAPPDFALKDTDGKEHKLSWYKGRVCLLHFSRLGDCEFGDILLTRMKAKYGERLVVRDLVVDESGGGVLAVRNGKKPATFPRLVGGASVADDWGVAKFPTAVVLGPDGRVVTIEGTGLLYSPRGTLASIADESVKRMDDYLRNPAKGW